MATTIQEDLVATGAVNFAGASSMQHKSGSITNADVIADAGIEYSKLEHYQLFPTNFNLAIGAAPAAREEIVFVARSAGVIRSFIAGLNDTGTATVSVDFDLNINGSTALSADVNVDHNDADRLNVAGTITSSALVVGDVVSISCESVTANNSTGPFAQVGISYANPA